MGTIAGSKMAFKREFVKEIFSCRFAVYRFNSIKSLSVQQVYLIDFIINYVKWTNKKRLKYLLYWIFFADFPFFVTCTGKPDDIWKINGRYRVFIFSYFFAIFAGYGLAYICWCAMNKWWKKKDQEENEMRNINKVIVKPFSIYVILISFRVYVRSCKKGILREKRFYIAFCAKMRFLQFLRWRNKKEQNAIHYVHGQTRKIATNPHKSFSMA